MCPPLVLHATRMAIPHHHPLRRAFYHGEVVRSPMNDTPNLLNAALEYFDKRNWAIHPLAPKDKKPISKEWSKWSNELPAREQVINWWKENPNYNIGLVTGKASGVVVLDVDLPKNPNAIAELEAIAGESTHKKIICPFVRTPGGGLHAYFAYPEGANIGCSSISIEGIDTRGNGGNIVLPPSIHPNGGIYRWHLPLEDRDLPPLPNTIVARLDKDRPMPKPRPVDAKLNPNDLLSVMMERCAFCREFTPDTGDIHEELWYRWLTQMVCYEGGIELACELSSGSPKFDDSTTRKKIEHAQEALAKGLAPYRCDEIIKCEGWTSEECQSCIAHPDRRNASPAGLPYILRSIEQAKDQAGISTGDKATIDTDETNIDPIPDEVLDEMAEKEKSQKQPIAYVTEPIDESDIDITPSISIPILPETVWRGIFAKYRELMSPTSEASDAYYFASLLTTVGALMGRSVMVYYAGELYPNIYTVIEGPTGISRKSSATKSAIKTIRDVDPTLIIRRSLSTVEGLINILKAPTEEELEEYEQKTEAFKKELIAQEPEKPIPIFEYEGRRLLVTFDEFSLLLKKTKRESSSTLIQGLTEAYDCPDTLDNPTKERPMSAYKPCVSLIGLTTKAWLERTLDYDDLLGGFVNRFIFFMGEPKNPIPKPPKPDANAWNHVKICLQQARNAYHKASSKEGSSQEYTLTTEADELWESYYLDWYQRQRQCNDETMTCLWQRLPNHAMKTALLYGCLEDKQGTAQITCEQLQAGIDLATYAEKSYEYLFRGFGFSKRARIEATIEEKLKMRRMTRRELRHAISSAIDTGELNTAILNMTRIGKVGEISVPVGKDSMERRRRKTVLVLLK